MLTLLEGGTTRNASDDLWSVLARAHACQRLAVHQSDLAFTVGLLSGAADLLGSEPADVADGSGVGAEARSALLDGDGEAGRALKAVLAHEQDDVDGIVATGLVPFDVSRAYLESLSESLQLVHDLMDPEDSPPETAGNGRQTRPRPIRCPARHLPRPRLDTRRDRRHLTTAPPHPITDR